jgi:hypothetical protein
MIIAKLLAQDAARPRAGTPNSDQIIEEFLRLGCFSFVSARANGRHPLKTGGRYEAVHGILLLFRSDPAAPKFSYVSLL